MSYLRLKLTKSRTARGFTLVEVMVAIFIGLIVMGMAVSILGATNSTAIRVLTKSEIQRNTTAAMIKIFNDASDAESLEVCRVGVDKDTQDAIASAAYTGQPGISIGNCKETASSGIVVAWAFPNHFCYFKTEKTNGALSTTPARIKCIARGGVGALNGRLQSFSGDPGPGVLNPITVASPVRSPHNGINITACVNFEMPNSSFHEIFTYECPPGGAAAGTVSSINWPASYNAPTNISMISDVGSNFVEPPNINLFTYRLSGGSTPLANGTVMGEVELKKIVAVDVNLRGKYNSGVNNETRNFYFNHTILLRGSELAQEENANENF